MHFRNKQTKNSPDSLKTSYGKHNSDTHTDNKKLF